MKNFTIKSLLILTVIVLSSYSVPESFMGVKKILGEWDYMVPDASYEYQKGVLFLDKVDGELTGEVRIGGQGMALENIVFEKKNLKGDIYVQGEIVKLDLNFSKKTFEGTVTYSQGSMKMNGTKK